MLQVFGPAIFVAAVGFGIALCIGNWSNPKPVAEFRMSLAVWWAQLVAAMIAICLVGFLGISTPHCSPDCEWDLLEYNLQVFMWAMAAVQLTSLVLIVLLRRNRRVWVVPVAAVALIVVLSVISSAIAYKAMLFF